MAGDQGRLGWHLAAVLHRRRVIGSTRRSERKRGQAGRQGHPQGQARSEGEQPGGQQHAGAGVVAAGRQCEDQRDRQGDPRQADPQRLGHHHAGHPPARDAQARSTAYSRSDAAVAAYSVWLVTAMPTSRLSKAVKPMPMPASVRVAQ